MQEQARHLAERMAANRTITTRTTERPDGALALTLALIIGSYFAARILFP